MSTMLMNAARPQKALSVRNGTFRRFREALTYGLMRGVAYALVLAVGFILFDIVVKGLPTINWEFLTAFPSQSGAAGGILPAIVGTLCLVGLAVAVALPLGVGSAIYLTEYAHQNRLTALIRLGIVTLAGVPSIVFGLFGLALFVIVLSDITRSLWGFATGPSIFAGGMTLACMILPTIIVATEEALRTVPKSLREASLALGATKWRTILTNVLPYALPGILTGSILAVGRAAGETAPILLTAAAFFLPALPESVFDSVMALPYHLYILATQHPDATAVRPMQYGTALVLLMLVFGINIVAVVIRNHFREKFRW